MRPDLLALSFCWLICTHLNAQTDSVRPLPIAEITAFRLQNFAIGQTQISSDSLQIQQWRNARLMDFLQTQTTLNLKSYGTGLSTLSLRGMAANHTAMVWNGFNLQNPLNGNNDAAIVAVGAVERISVQLGGSSALFGAGAIGGVIFLENVRPTDNGFHAQLGYAVGSFGEQKKEAKAQFGAKKWSANVGFQTQAADNNFTFRNTAEIGQPLQNAQHAAYDLKNWTSNVFFQPSEKDILKFHFWKSDNYREITPTMTAATNNAVLRDTADRLAVDWTHTLRRAAFKVRAAYLSDKNQYTSNTIQNSRNNVRTIITEAEYWQSLGQKNQLRIGINHTNERADNNNYTTAPPERTRVALSLNEAFRSPIVDISANVRQEYVQNQFTPTTFSIGAEKKLNTATAAQKWTLRGAWSRNFNLPTFNDLYWANLGNPDLTSEQGYSGEFGVSTERKTARAAWSAHLTFFDIDVQNRIVWLPSSDGQFRPTNLHQARSQGIEAWAQYKIMRSHGQYQLCMNYQFANARDGNGGAMLFVPTHKGSVSLAAQYRNWSWAWQQTASDRRYATTDRSTATEPFTVADATIGFAPAWWRHAEIRLQITNVLDADYQVIPYYPNPKRAWHLSVLGYF